MTTAVFVQTGRTIQHTPEITNCGKIIQILDFCIAKLSNDNHKISQKLLQFPGVQFQNKTQNSSQRQSVQTKHKTEMNLCDHSDQ